MKAIYNPRFPDKIPSFLSRSTGKAIEVKPGGVVTNGNRNYYTEDKNLQQTVLIVEDDLIFIDEQNESND